MKRLQPVRPGYLGELPAVQIERFENLSRLHLPHVNPADEPRTRRGFDPGLVLRQYSRFDIRRRGWQTEFEVFA